VYSVRRVVFECATVLLVAVRTAVTRWQLGVLRDDQGGSPLDPQMLMPLAGRSRVDESRCHTGYTGHFSLVGTYSRLRT
jgi:hypothetical protein